MGILDYLGGKYDEYKQSEMPLAYLLRGDYQGFPEAYKQNAINSSYGLLTDTMEGKNLPMGGILGKTKIASKTEMELANEIASKNAETMLGLPKGNTAMDRAKAMGFDVDNPVYHGTYRDYQSIDPNKSFYVTPNPEYASLYTNPSASSMGGKKAQDFIDPQGNVMKVLIRNENILNTKTPKGLNVFNKEFYGQYGNATPLSEKGYPDWADAEDFAQMFADKNMPYKGVMVDEGKTPSFTGKLFDRGISTAIFDPKQVRSVNAAFDPARANENDILAGMMALPVSGLLQEPKKKKNK